MFKSSTSVCILHDMQSFMTTGYKSLSFYYSPWVTDFFYWLTDVIFFTICHVHFFLLYPLRRCCVFWTVELISTGRTSQEPHLFSLPAGDVIITEYFNMSVVCAFNQHHRHTAVFNIVIGLQPWPKRHSTDSSLSRCQISCWQEWNYSSGSVCAGGLFVYFHWLSVMGFVFTKLHVYDLGWIWGNLWDPHSASQQIVPNTHPDDTEWWY